MRGQVAAALLMLGAVGARADDAKAPEAAAPEAKAPAKAGEAREDYKPHVDAAAAFLKAWGHGKFDEMKAVAADKVAVKLGGAAHEIDVAGGKSDVKMNPVFRKLSVVREGGKITGVAVGELSLKAGADEKKGPATLTTSSEGGAVKVTAVTLE